MTPRAHSKTPSAEIFSLSAELLLPSAEIRGISSISPLIVPHQLTIPIVDSEHLREALGGVVVSEVIGHMVAGANMLEHRDGPIAIASDESIRLLLLAHP